MSCPTHAHSAEPPVVYRRPGELAYSLGAIFITVLLSFDPRARNLVVKSSAFSVFSRKPLANHIYRYVVALRDTFRFHIPVIFFLDFFSQNFYSSVSILFAFSPPPPLPSPTNTHALGLFLLSLLLQLESYSGSVSIDVFNPETAIRGSLSGSSIFFPL